LDTVSGRLGEKRANINRQKDNRRALMNILLNLGIDMTDIEPDGELTEEQKALVAQLTDDDLRDIDEALMEQVHPKHSRKVAAVVGRAMGCQANRINGVPDVFYAQRVLSLVEKGYLDIEGDPRYMGRAEVSLARRADLTSESNSGR
jgi:hypothetical protein